jgi:nucleoside-diphosphate-sugar epimerase
MNILITGTDGYIGVRMAPYLRARGHQVTGLDTGFYKDGWLYHVDSDAPATLNKDLRRTEEKDFHGFDAVVHLAELSNDPLGQLNPGITKKINHEGSIHLARLAKKAGVKRFVYASSCSVYGIGTDAFVTEESPVNPLTAYAQCKAAVEKDLAGLLDKGFTTTCLRNATAYGASPRMRFDIVLNNLSALAWTLKRIAMTSDGTPWRPLVHVLDICEAVACVLEAPAEAVHGEIFNVGDSDHNYRVREIAEFVAKAQPGCELSFGKSDPDNRSYRVSFAKIRKHMPAFKCNWDAAKGAAELHAAFERIQMSDETFKFRAFTRLKQLEYLVKTGQIDNEFFWK